jgi:hypothetical protein
MIKDFNGKVIDNFVEEDFCNKIIELVEDLPFWEDADSLFWSNRTLGAETIYTKINAEIGKELHYLKNKIKDAIVNEYKIQEEIYADVFQIVRWFPGMEQPPHADDMTHVDGYEGYNHKRFATVLYLNNNYLGGNTYYPDYDISIEPAIGRLAIHPASTDHMHGVTKIKKSIRYTIATFWTFEKKYNHEWYSDQS